MTRIKKGYTLLEIMLVVSIIALMAALVIPSFLGARSKSMRGACQSNLRLIDGAIQQYALDNSNTVANTLDSLVGTNAYLKDTPVCKGGGTYTLPPDLFSKTSCTVHGTL